MVIFKLSNKIIRRRRRSRNSELEPEPKEIFMAPQHRLVPKSRDPVCDKYEV